MARPHYSLAIETSCPQGGVALGRDDTLLEAVSLGEQRRHAVRLMPSISELCAKHDVRPGDLNEIHVSTGPGSFTGLRVAITTAKMLAHMTGARLIAVSTLQTIACNAPPEIDRVAVCLNAKRGQCFTGMFERDGTTWRQTLAPCLMTPLELADQSGGVMAVIGDAAVQQLDWPKGCRRLDPALADPRAESVWQIGRRLSRADQTVDPIALVPHYVRLPEAEEVWRQRQNAGAQPA